MVQITSENSLIWDKFRAGTMLIRLPFLSRCRIGEIETKRETITNTETAAAAIKISGVGRGIFVPRATKNSVIKKSRRLTILATTSKLYGKAEIETPATRAPISR